MLLLLSTCRAVCRKHELTQFELEVASQDLISKKQQREELATGVCSIYCSVLYVLKCLYHLTWFFFIHIIFLLGWWEWHCFAVPVQIVRTFSLKGMTNKLFGQEAPEQREARLKLLEELIAEGEDAVKEKTLECEWVTEQTVHPNCRKVPPDQQGLAQHRYNAGSWASCVTLVLHKTVTTWLFDHETSRRPESIMVMWTSYK